MKMTVDLAKHTTLLTYPFWVLMKEKNYLNYLDFGAAYWTAMDADNDDNDDTKRIFLVSLHQCIPSKERHGFLLLLVVL